MKRSSALRCSDDVEPRRKKPTTEPKTLDFAWDTHDVLGEFCGSADTSFRVCRYLDEGSSIPFLARYRRNETRNMSADELRDFKDKYELLKDIRVKTEKLAETIIKEEKMSDSLKKSLERIRSQEEFDLISAPFKASSKKSLASRARAVPGMEEAALSLLQSSSSTSKQDNCIIQQLHDPSIEGRSSFKDIETNISNILADVIVHDADVMSKVAELVRDARPILIQSTARKAVSKSDKKKEDKYECYHSFSTSIKTVKPHQILAINRGESEKFLSVKVVLPDWFKNQYFKYCETKYKVYSTTKSIRSNMILSSIEDGYKRLTLPSVQRRIRSDLTKQAEKESIDVFALNLRKLLLTPPVRDTTILGIDPGFKNGCKMAVISSKGHVLDTGIFYLSRESSLKELLNLIRNYEVKIVALGNGTACRETENIIASLIKKEYLDITYTIVNEQGASIYSCSKMAKGEFPSMDTNLISAVSIASRLRDPLAEYTKIEPKHLGVGMYQHDISEAKLKKTLEEIVSECVSFVGVDLNSAPKYLLEKVSGLSKTTAEAIIKWREKNKGFKSRSDLSSVKGIGKKTFQLCSGFVKIFPSNIKSYPSDNNPLDSTLIHPESYDVALKILKKNGFTLSDVGKSKLINHFNSFSSFVVPNDLKIDPETHELIIKALGQNFESDCRESESKPLFRKEVLSFKDLRVEESILSGKVTNVTHFGAFLDCGVGVNGLLHISKMKGQSIELGQRLCVKVISIEAKKQKLGLEFLKFE